MKRAATSNRQPLADLTRPLTAVCMGVIPAFRLANRSLVAA